MVSQNMISWRICYKLGGENEITNYTNTSEFNTLYKQIHTIGLFSYDIMSINQYTELYRCMEPRNTHFLISSSTTGTPSVWGFWKRLVALPKSHST